MNSVKQHLLPSNLWFRISIAAIFFVSVILRFWGLSRFNTLVFDEVYYAQFGNNYLNNTPFFNAHPPLSQYIIAIGIWLGNYLPFGKDITNSLTGSEISTFSYRWMNALTGSFVPLIIGAIAYQLSYRRSYALIAALFSAADGLFLVESRYALNNIYLVILGLLGQLFLLLALATQAKRRWSLLAIAGIFFGAAIAIKWNGLWFLLGAYMLWISAWLIQWWESRVSTPNSENLISNLPKLPLQNITQLNFLQIIVNLALIPIFVYSISWIPHLQMNPQPGFFEVQKQILTYHQGIGNGQNVHPYCSNWYTWLLMIRPIAYFYYDTKAPTKNVPDLTSLNPDGSQIIYDVHAMGNPILWVLSTGTILLLFLIVCRHFFNFLSSKTPTPPYIWIALYLVLNYAANLLPWARVTRCVFLYHYMGASVFSLLAMAWITDTWLTSDRPSFRATAVTIIFLILLAFVFWLPIYLGLPLSSQEHRLRMMFPSWI